MGVLLSPSAPSQKKRSGQIKHAGRPVTLLKKDKTTTEEKLLNSVFNLGTIEWVKSCENMLATTWRKQAPFMVLLGFPFASLSIQIIHKLNTELSLGWTL